MFNFLRKNLFGIVSVEERLQTFLDLGFKINPGIDIQQEAKNWELTSVDPADIYSLLGSVTQEEPWTPLTNQVWNFDTEAIEDNGSYISILENIRRIAQGELSLENISDEVDIQAGKAVVEFDLDDQHYRWTLKVDNDWVDIDLFIKLSELAKKRNTKGNLTWYSDGGQEVVFSWLTPDELKALKKATGLRVEWVK